MSADKPLLGIALMAGFCVLAPIGDSIAKLLGGTVPLAQLLLVRFVVQGAILLPFVWAAATALARDPELLRLTLLRTALHIVGIGAMFTALRYLPLADAVAIAFVMPFILLMLGRLFAGEEVGPRRLLACAVGFVGTLMVIQPSFAEVGWPALWPLLVAVAFALFMLVTRRIATRADPVALQALSGGVAGVVLLPAVLIGDGTQAGAFGWIWPETRYIWLLAAVGVVGTVAHLLMTWSLRFAPSATLAPMQYLEIPFAALIGWIVFADLPDGLAAAGIVVIATAGLYVVFRERAMARAIKTEAPPV